jgi:hypothetical protein
MVCATSTFTSILKTSPADAHIMLARTRDIDGFDATFITHERSNPLRGFCYARAQARWTKNP